MKRVFNILLFLLASVNSYAQFVTVSDTNLAKAICRSYPEIMDAQCVQLDTGKAEHVDFIIDVSRSNISNASELTYFNRADSIILSGNGLNYFLGDIKSSNFWSLSYLDLSDNAFTEFPRFSVNPDFPHIQSFLLQNNQATEFQKLWSARDSLRILNISNNYISEVEDYSMALEATLIDLSNNYLTFEDLLPQTNHPDFENVFVVGPQRQVEWSNTVETGKEHQSFVLQLPIDNNVTSNTYAWYKDGEFLKNTTTNSLSFDSLKLEDAGVYSVRITNANPLLASVELQTGEVELQVNHCMDVAAPAIEIDEKCNGARAQFIDDPLINGVAPYSYELNSGDKVFTGVDSTHHELPIREYTMTVRDAVGCEKVYSEKVIVNGFVGCDDNVITPDGDGLQDEYYFEVEGDVKIYNRVGHLIRELSLPKFWDGKTEQGQPVPPGKYVIVINEEEKVYVKVVW